MRKRFPLATALLDSWEHPHSSKYMRFLYWALYRARKVVNPSSVSPEAVQWWFRVTGYIDGLEHQ